MYIWFISDQIWKKMKFRNDANVFFTGTEIIPVPLIYGDSLPFDSFEMLKKWDASMYSDSLPDIKSMSTDEEMADFHNMKFMKQKFDRYVRKCCFSSIFFVIFNIINFHILHFNSNAMSEMELFHQVIDFVFIFNQVTYFAKRLAEFDPADVGLRARVMLTYIVTPRLFIHSRFDDKVKIFCFPNWWIESNVYFPE